MSTADLEHVVARLAQEVERRFFGKYRGFVVDNDDPEKLGRLKLTVPSVLGEDVVTGWAMPCLPYGGAANRGVLFVPETDFGVWVEFEEGDLEFPIWVGTFWSKPGGESELPKPNDAEGAEEGEVQGPPTRKIVKTSSGHTLQFEDADDEVRVLIADGQNENRIVLGRNGLVVTGRDNVVTLDASGVAVEDKNGNRVVMDASGVTLEDKNGNQVVMASGGIQLGGGAATEPFVLGNRFALEVQSFLLALSTHTHVGNMGAPTSPPTSPLTLNVPLSGKHKVE